MGVEGECEVVGGNEKDTIIGFLFELDLLPHLIAHVVANEQVN